MTIQDHSQSRITLNVGIYHGNGNGPTDHKIRTCYLRLIENRQYLRSSMTFYVSSNIFL